MRKILITVTLCVLGVVLVSCGGGKSAPVNVAKGYAEAFYNGDFKKCNAMLEMPEEMSDDDLSQTIYRIIRENMDKYQYQFTYNEENSTFEAAAASVSFDVTSKTHPEFSDSGVVSLKKTEEGKWVVASHDLPID